MSNSEKLRAAQQKVDDAIWAMAGVEPNGEGRFLALFAIARGQLAAAADHIKEALEALPAEPPATAVVGVSGRPARAVVVLNSAAEARDYFGHGGCDGFFYPARVTVAHVHEGRARVTTVVCSGCDTPLLFTARARGDELCGPCSRAANGTRTDADAARSAARFDEEKPPAAPTERKPNY